MGIIQADLPLQFIYARLDDPAFPSPLSPSAFCAFRSMDGGEIPQCWLVAARMMRCKRKNRQGTMI